MKDSLEILPVTPLIGAEVIGIDLSEPLTNHQKDAIHKAFLKHSVLFFAPKIYRSNSKRILAEVLVNYIFIPQETATDLKVILRFYTSTLGPIHQGSMGMSGTQTYLVMKNLPLVVF